MSGDLIRQLAALGLDTEQVAGVLDIMEAQAEAGKEKARARWRKWKASQPETTVSKRLPTTANVDSPLTREPARVEDNLLTKELAGKEEERKQDNAPKARGSDLADFKAELSPVLDAERIEAVIKHRRSKRGQITGLSARLFLADANACGLLPSDAVDTCISRNWITVKPEYLNGNGSRSTRSTGPPRGRPTAIDAYEQIAREKGWTSEPAILPSDNGDGERLPPERNGSSGAVVDLRRGTDGVFGSGDPGDGEALHRRRHS